MSYGRHLGFADLRLFVTGLRLASSVRGEIEQPISSLVDTVARRHGGFRTPEPRRALAAATRACLRASQWFAAKDSCLIRCLVLAGLLDLVSNEVILHLGLRPPADAEVDGHAWLTVNGERFEPTTAPESGLGEHEEMMRIRISPPE